MCGKEIASLHQLIGFSVDPACPNCRYSWQGKVRSLKCGLGDVTYCYRYGPWLGDLFYRYKTVGDIRLGAMFLHPYVRILRKRYSDCLLIRMPSWGADDEVRGYNHVEEIFRCLNRPIISPFIKLKKEKQSDKNREDRMKVSQIIGLRSDFDRGEIVHRKIVLVDDVMTTGSTLRQAMRLLEITEVEIFVVAVHPLLIDEMSK